MRISATPRRNCGRFSRALANPAGESLVPLFGTVRVAGLPEFWFGFRIACSAQEELIGGHHPHYQLG